MLPPMLPGIQQAGLEGTTWSILGQTYTPLSRTEACMAWHALLPPGTFVPPHIHRTQDEYVYVLEGTLDLDANGTTTRATNGALVSLPRNHPHGLYNRTPSPLTCLFWVTPTAQLWTLFSAIHNEPNPAEVVRQAARYAIDFLPPE